MALVWVRRNVDDPVVVDVDFGDGDDEAGMAVDPTACCLC
jgi:hypothetical protein